MSAVATAVQQISYKCLYVPCNHSGWNWFSWQVVILLCTGAYTTARTMNGDLVFMLSSHIQRLATSANLMMDADARVSSVHHHSSVYDSINSCSCNSSSDHIVQQHCKDLGMRGTPS